MNMLIGTYLCIIPPRAFLARVPVSSIARTCMAHPDFFLSPALPLPVWFSSVLVFTQGGEVQRYMLLGSGPLLRAQVFYTWALGAYAPPLQQATPPRWGFWVSCLCVASTPNLIRLEHTAAPLGWQLLRFGRMLCLDARFGPNLSLHGFWNAHLG